MAGLYVGITDLGWYQYLSGIPDLDEVNFWQPSGSRGFRVLDPGGLFLFKLHSPNDFVVGGGIFAHWSPLPVSLAWEAFGDRNGVADRDEMVARLASYSNRVRTMVSSARLGHQIGCILLQQPFFLPREQWIPIGDWAPNIVQGRSYDLAGAQSQRLLAALAERRQATPLALAEHGPRFGEPVLVRPRLGQGSFRVLVTDAYSRRCAMTGERVLPVLQAAHIRPYADGGEHRVDNGLLLRSDLHTLFDGGFIGVDPDYRITVSKRLRDDFHNGKEYYALEGRQIALPGRREDRPDHELLAWHSERVVA
jgi:putative restriction endonuclease